MSRKMFPEKLSWRGKAHPKKRWHYSTGWGLGLNKEKASLQCTCRWQIQCDKPLPALATMLPSPWTCTHTHMCSNLPYKNVFTFNVKIPGNREKVLILSSKVRIGAAILAPSWAPEVSKNGPLELLFLPCPPALASFSTAVCSSNQRCGDTKALPIGTSETNT